MNYLTKLVPVFVCAHCGCEGPRHAFAEDPYSSDLECHCGHAAKYDRNHTATWWSVGVYSCWQTFGGPEEGGWYYWEGALTDHWKVRVFEDYDLAVAYQRELLRLYEPNREIQIHTYTERLPLNSFPERRPVYC